MKFLLATLLLTLEASAAGWIPLAPVQTARQEMPAVTAGGKLYVLGGISPEPAALTSVEEYDPQTNQWQFVAPLPRPRHHAAAAAVGQFIYVIGGDETLDFIPESTVYRFDTVANRWTEVAPLPNPRAALAAVTIGGKIYAVGGVPNYRQLSVYDPATDTWTDLAPMPTGREHLAAVAVNGRLYVIGGRIAANSDAMEVYDPPSNSWRRLPPLPTARGGLTAAAIGTRIFVFGGEGNPRTPTGVYSEVESFDTVSEQWRTEAPAPNPRHGMQAVTIGNRIHIPSGAPVQGFGTTDVHDALVFTTAPPRRAVRSAR